MKMLYLIRHAKSSWDDYTLSDDKRPLNERGKRDAPNMARMLYDKDPDIQLFITSPAKRARFTAKIFGKVYHLGKGEIKKDGRLYLASPSQIQQVVQEISNELEKVAIFGHNPGMTDFLNRFSGGSVDNIPTCGIARVEFDVSKWKEIEPGLGRMTDFYYPKMFGLI
jgi:phosphohistidine phosphatase